MSADNGIYILEHKEGFRVTHAQCIENLNWWPVTVEGIQTWEERPEMNPKEIKRYFGQSKLYKTLDDAFKKAEELSKEHWYTEYGICFVRGWEGKEFPK